MIRLETTVCYTVQEVAEMLNMHKDTIRKYITSGKLRAHKVGGVYYITDRALTLLVTGEEPQPRNNNNDI